MTTSDLYIKAMKKLGSEWQKGTMHRIYFNNLESLYGLKCERYNSGNISSATLDGDPISNTRARQIEACLSGAKVWYDLTSDQFNGRDIEKSMLNKIVAGIKYRVENTVDELNEQEICK